MVGVGSRCSWLAFILVAILVVGLLWPDPESTQTGLAPREGKRKRPRRPTVPLPVSQNTVYSTFSMNARAPPAPQATPAPASASQPHRSSESSSPLPSHRAAPSATMTNFIRVSWLGRNMNLQYRADPVLRLLENITRARASLSTADGGPYLPDDTDVFLLQASELANVKAARKAHASHALFLFVATEEVYRGDNRLQIADVSFGQAPWQPHAVTPCSNANDAPNFLRTPSWVLRTIECSWDMPTTCRINPDILSGAAVKPEAWAARPGFALHIARHGGFPRELLLSEFRALGARVDRAGPFRNRTVDCPGSGPHCAHMAWPSDLPNNVQGKLALARRYRYSIQPENRRSECQGYMTEKVPEGFMAGAVPVYWGDPPDLGFWNPARMLILESDAPKHVAALVARAEALEMDASARAAFFSQPAVQPGAEAWVRKWCAKATRLLRAALLKHPVLRERFPPVF